MGAPHRSADELDDVADRGDRRRRRPIHPVPPSHQQEAYLRAAQRNQSAGFRFSRLCLQAFDFHSPLDADALTRTIDAFLRRHDTFRCWFSEEPDGSIARHVVDPAIISMTPTTHGDMDSASAIREHIQNETPGPFSWDCFTFGAIEWEGGFTLYGAIDHLDTDGISQALTCTELITLYMNEAFGLDTGLPEVGSYIEYCDHERTVSAALTRQAPQVCRWVELLQANGGVLPGFPLPLGGESEDHTRSALLTMSVFSEDDAQRFEDVCRAHDSNMTAGLMAVAALASYEFSGCTEYLGMTPKSTRAPGPALNSVGWFTSLIPVPITVGADATFTSIVGPAARVMPRVRNSPMCRCIGYSSWSSPTTGSTWHPDGRYRWCPTSTCANSPAWTFSTPSTVVCTAIGAAARRCSCGSTDSATRRR